MAMSFWSLEPTVVQRRPSTRWYEVTTDVAVGQMRQIELLR
jgi:hypothetical protein